MSEFNQPTFSPQNSLGTPTATQPSSPQPATGTNRIQEIHRVVSEMYRQNPDWVTFFREVLGVDGVIRRLFPNPVDLANFEQTQEYIEIQGMLAKLRERSKHQTESNEPTRVITVRLPKSLHESLRAEAHERRTSMNQLCISKLLQIIDNELVPSD